MRVVSLGKIAVPTPGTAVRVSTDATLLAARLRFEAVVGETGRTFLGVQGMNKNTGAGVVKEFWPTGAGGGVADSFEIESGDGTNCLWPGAYYVDANTANEGVIVSYWVR